MTDADFFARLQALRAQHREAYGRYRVASDAEARLIEQVRAAGGTVHGLQPGERGGWHVVTVDDRWSLPSLAVSQWPEEGVTAETAIRPDLGADALALKGREHAAFDAMDEASEDAAALVKDWIQFLPEGQGQGQE